MSSTSAADGDSLLTLAFSVYSNPGAYAMLLGAGISAAADVPTAWGVLTDLISKTAHVLGEDVAVEDAEQWYLTHHNGDAPRYETLLERLAPTPIERQRLLRQYFEGSATAEDDDAGMSNRPVPSIAHKSIARLVKRGVVKVLVTMNFDRLMETAIRDEGIEPTVVASEADVLGLAPLHTLTCCVIHLHGDYLNPETMLNTTLELENYRPNMQGLLKRLLEDYGLVIAGWSATYDPALRSAIAANYSPRLTMAWVEPFAQSEVATDLALLKNAQVLRMDADTAFGTLADSVESIATARSRHPRTVSVAATTAKRSLSGRWTAIDLHDSFGAELELLHSNSNFNLPTYDGYNQAQYHESVSQIWEASRVPAALIAVMAYWGDSTTDSWWFDEIDRFATRPRVSGLVAMIKLRTIAGSFLFYSAGVAAVAAKRYDLLSRLLRKSAVDTWTQQRKPLFNALDPSVVYEIGHRPDHNHYLQVHSVLSQALCLPEAKLENAWQHFEVLRHAANLVNHPSMPGKAKSYRSAYGKYAELLSQNATGGPEGVTQKAIRDAFIDQDKIVGEVADLASMRQPHIFANEVERDGKTSWGSPVADRIAFDLEEEGNVHPLITCDAGGLDGSELTLAVKAVGVQVARIAHELETGMFIDGQVHRIPDEMWLDVGIEH